MTEEIAVLALRAATALDRRRRDPGTDPAPVEALADRISALDVHDGFSSDIELATVVVRTNGEEPRTVSDLAPALERAVLRLRAHDDAALRLCLGIHSACLARSMGFDAGRCGLAA